MYNYTYDLVNSLVSQGTAPDIVSIGNETNHGFLWPTAEVNQDGNNNWDNYANLLKTGISAVKAASPSTLTMIHTDEAASVSVIHSCLDNLFSRGVRPDVLGFSYYTAWSAGDLPAVTTTMTDAISSYGLPIMIVETAYPWISGSYIYYASANGTYPFTPAGQKEYLKDLCARVKSLPGGQGLGVLWWAPDGIQPTSQNYQWNNGSGFDFNNGNKALPGLGAFFKN